AKSGERHGFPSPTATIQSLINGKVGLHFTLASRKIRTFLRLPHPPAKPLFRKAAAPSYGGRNAAKTGKRQAWNGMEPIIGQGGAAPAGADGLIIDTTTQNFTRDVLEASRE